MKDVYFFAAYIYFCDFFSGISLESQTEHVDYVKLLPENLFLAVECCLDDKHERVALAAAIALYTLERPTTKVS